MEANIINLQQLYLMTLVQVAKADKLDAILQDNLGQDAGRLWLVKPESTVPVAAIQFKFDRDAVHFEVMHRDDRALKESVKYAEGLDGFIEKLTRFMQANRLAAPKKAA